MTAASRRFDVVVVGSRVAGAPTAMLLARLGLRVLLTDRARFPTDTLSSHQLHVPGVAALQRWGLLEQVRGDGTPAVRDLQLTVRDAVVRGRLPEVEGVDYLLSPRRTRLDQTLRQAAVEAGVELAEGFTVDDVVMDGDRVVGVQGRDGSRVARRIQAQLVVGADGRNSTVAEAVRAPTIASRPQQTVAGYTYWSGWSTCGAEIYHLPGRAVAVFPTDDGLTVTFVAAPISELPAMRRDPFDFVRYTLTRCAGTRDSALSAQPAERTRLAPQLPHRILRSAGAGWALVGDAGLVIDPVTAHGMTNALLAAEMLASAVARAMAHGRPLDSYLHLYEHERNQHLDGMFNFTADIARLAPDRLGAAVVRGIGRSEPAVEALLAMFSGVGPADLLSVRGLSRTLAAPALMPKVRSLRALSGSPGVGRTNRYRKARPQ